MNEDGLFYDEYNLYDFPSCAKMKKEVLKYMGELDVYRNRCR